MQRCQTENLRLLDLNVKQWKHEIQSSLEEIPGEDYVIILKPRRRLTRSNCFLFSSIYFSTKDFATIIVYC